MHNSQQVKYSTFSTKNQGGICVYEESRFLWALQLK